MNKKDRDFELEIAQYLEEMVPPEEEIQRINPWKEAIESISFGLAFTTISLNFLLLQYILPTIGVILIYLGFRSLRNENNYFKFLWVIAIIKLVLQLVSLICLSSPLNTMEHLNLSLGIVSIIVQIFMFLIFHKAISEVYAKANKDMEASPLLWALAWTVAAFLIALSPLSNSWLVFIPMTIFYILIVRSIISIGDQFDHVGYVLQGSSVRVNNASFGWAYFLISFSLALAINVFYNHHKLDSQKFEAHSPTALRLELERKGLPSQAMEYLKEEELELIKDSTNIEAITGLLMFDPKEESHTFGNMTTVTEKPGNKNLEVTSVYIEMPDLTFYTLHYFKWQESGWQGPKPVWQEAINIETREELGDKEIINKGLFYKKKGLDYVADFPSFKMEEVEVNHMFGSYRSSPILLGFSYPFGSKSQGGYILYRQKMDSSTNYLALSNVNYYHSSFPFRIPYQRREDELGRGHYWLSNSYQQHYTTYEFLGYEKDSD